MRKFTLMLENMNQDQIVDFIYKTYYESVKKTFDKIKTVKKTKLDPALVLAIIMQESRGHPFASRYEPDFYSWLSARITGPDLAPFVKMQSKNTEMTLRSTSFGLMQIMGQTARECGFTGPFLTELTDIDVNLYFGVVYLERLANRYEDINDVIAAYNAGSAKKNDYGNYRNQGYVTEVNDKLFLFKKKFFNKEVESA